MNIIFNEQRMPGQAVIDKMIQSAEICVQTEGLDIDRVEISLSFVTDEEIRELNKLYRKVDKVTDVLSFPQYEDLNKIPREGSICIGDVVICTDQALLQADEFGHSPEREIIYLFVHSVLHLLGYDHMNSEEKEQMREREEIVMSKIGLER